MFLQSICPRQIGGREILLMPSESFTSSVQMSRRTSLAFTFTFVACINTASNTVCLSYKMSAKSTVWTIWLCVFFVGINKINGQVLFETATNGVGAVYTMTNGLTMNQALGWVWMKMRNLHPHPHPQDGTIRLYLMQLWAFRKHSKNKACGLFFYSTHRSWRCEDGWE